MVTLPTGLTVPQATDAYQPDADIRTLAGSLAGKIVTPVATVTERAALVASLTWTPSPSRPVYVHREDAPEGRQLEVTMDGTTWRTIAAAPQTMHWIQGKLQRSDGSMTLNVGETDLRVTSLTSEPSGAGVVWAGSGIYHPTPGLWWVYANLDESASGARWGRVYPTAWASDVIILGTIEAQDTASTGYGRAACSSLFYCPSGLAVRFRAYNNVGGTIRSTANAGAALISS